MKSLVHCIGIEEGVTAFVGGGGKTTTIYTLAKELHSRGKKVIVTTTTKMYMPKATEVRETLLAPTLSEVQNALLDKGFVAIGAGEREGKMLGVTEELISKIKEEADYILVEADGAKHYPLKVPANNEPVIPGCSSRVVIVVGMSALGKTIESTCFRQVEIEALLGVDRTHQITIEDIAQIISSSLGLSKGSEGRKVSVLLNQIDVVEEKEQIENLTSRLKDLGMKKIVMASVQQQKWGIA